MTWDFDRRVEVFNRAVTSGEWEEFVDLFAADATMEFHGPPVGPLTGRQEIAAAYRSSPPDDTLELTTQPHSQGDEEVVPFRWQRGGTTGRPASSHGRHPVGAARGRVRRGQHGR